MAAATSTSRSARRVTRAEWFALWLLVISICINYADRGNISVAGVAIQNELKLSNTELGVLISAFFWTYASFQMVAGWLIDRFNVVWVYATGFFLWSAATLLTGIAPTAPVRIVQYAISAFSIIFTLRLILGVSESVAYPSYSKIIAAGFPERNRGMANGLIDAGSKLGPAIGIFAGGLILNGFGWRWLFIIIGGASMLWLIPWCAVAGGIKTGQEAQLSEGQVEAPSYMEILRHRDAWGTFLGLFCGNYGWYFMLTWLPQYFIKARKYSDVMMAELGSLPFWFVAAGAVFGGWLSDRWILHGGTPTQVRKTFVVGGLTLFALIFMPGAIVANEKLGLALMVTASFCFGLFSSNLWTITQTLAGTTAAGKWTGAQNMCGNVAGIVVPVVTGFVLDRTGQFYWAVVSVCVLVLVGALSFLLVVRRVEPVAWSEGPKETNQSPIRL